MEDMVTPSPQSYKNDKNQIWIKKSFNSKYQNNKII